MKDNKSEEKDKRQNKGVWKYSFNGTYQRVQILPIIGQIEGHMVFPPQTKSTKYEHVIPQLIAIEQNDKVKGILIVLNTVGGDVEAGLAISEMIKVIIKTYGVNSNWRRTLYWSSTCYISKLFLYYSISNNDNSSGENEWICYRSISNI